MASIETTATERAGADPASHDERPLPFVLRVAARWSSFDELPHASDGQLFFRRKAPLTGQLALTSDGADLQFSDLEV